MQGRGGDPGVGLWSTWRTAEVSDTELLRLPFLWVRELLSVAAAVADSRSDCPGVSCCKKLCTVCVMTDMHIESHSLKLRPYLAD